MEVADRWREEEVLISLQTEFYQVGGRAWDGWVDRQTDRETEDRRTDGLTESSWRWYNACSF